MATQDTNRNKNFGATTDKNQKPTQTGTDPMTGDIKGKSGRDDAQRNDNRGNQQQQHQNDASGKPKHKSNY
jgi:hypothetical protein